MNFLSFFLYFTASNIIFKGIEIFFLYMYFKYKRKNQQKSLKEMIESGQVKIVPLSELQNLTQEQVDTITTGRKTWN